MKSNGWKHRLCNGTRLTFNSALCYGHWPVIFGSECVDYRYKYSPCEMMSGSSELLFVEHSIMLEIGDQDNSGHRPFCHT